MVHSKHYFSDLRFYGWRDQLPSLRVKTEAVHSVGQDIVGSTSKDVQMPIVRNLNKD